MAPLSRETLQAMARELFGAELRTGEVEEVLAHVTSWPERFTLLTELAGDQVEPAWLADPGAE